MDERIFKTIAKEKLKDNYSKTILMTIIAIGGSAITGIPNFRHQMLMFKSHIQSNTNIYMISAQTISMIITPIIALLAINFYTQMRNGVVESNTDMFKGLNIKKIGVAVLSRIISILLMFLWSLLLLIPGIIKSFSYSQTIYIIYDTPNISAIDAIKESKRLMHGHKLNLFILGLSFIAWDLLAIVTIGIASFYVKPYKQMAYLEFYNDIKKQIDCIEDKKSEDLVE